LLNKYLILYFIFSSHLALAQIKRSKFFVEKAQQTSIELFLENKSLGDLEVELLSETLLRLKFSTLKDKLRKILKENKVKAIENMTDEWIEAKQSPYPVRYRPEELKLEIQIPQEDIRASFYRLDNDPHIRYAGEQIAPAPVSGGINYYLDKSIAPIELGGDNFSAFTNTFINVHGLVLSSDLNYFESPNSEKEKWWFRGNTNLTYDVKEARIRLQAGDTQTQSFDFLEGRQLGGLSVQRNFTLDPYNRPFPEGEQEFQILKRSRVKTFINGTMMKDEILSQGNYRISGLPLINGLNIIRLEITEDGGEKRVLEYSVATSISMLKKGEFNFSVSQGKPFTDNQFNRVYSEHEVTNGFIQYGLTDIYSPGFYFQKNLDAILVGTGHGIATSLGNFYLGLATTSDEDSEGQASSLSWQYQRMGNTLFSGFSSLLRFEQYRDAFYTRPEDKQLLLEKQLSGSFTLPLSAFLSLTLGGSVAEYQDKSLQKREQKNGSLNWRFYRSVNLNFTASSIRDRAGEESLQASAFLTWSFDQSNQYITAYQDIENKNKRISYTRDNNNKLYRPRITVAVDETPSTQRGDLLAALPTPMADLALRASHTSLNQNKNLQAYGATLGSSMLFAYDKGLGFAIGRPSVNSFAIFKQSSNLKNEKIALRSNSPYADTETPLVGDLALSNLVPYQYREIQLDPMALNDGVSLAKEKFVLAPTYRSGHLILIDDLGLVSLQGKLIYKNAPLKLKTGIYNEQLFFTDREGQFYIEGIKPGKNKLEIENIGTLEIDIPNDFRGIYDIGSKVIQ
jgi:outer membrane usher protein